MKKYYYDENNGDTHTRLPIHNTCALESKNKRNELNRFPCPIEFSKMYLKNRSNKITRKKN